MNRSLKPGWIDRAAMALARPWVMVLAFAFLLAPSNWLLAALNSGAAFLKISAGARPAAMGEAYTALADDVNALYYNPAGLAWLSKRELGATHAEWLLGSKFDFMGFAEPTKLGTFGLGITRLASGSQEGRDPERRASGGFYASDTAYSLAFSRRLQPGLLFGSGETSLGASVKYLQSRIGPYSASTIAADFGARRQLKGRPLAFGFSMLNVGQGMRFISQTDPLPLTMALGASYRISGALQLALDARREIPDKRTALGIGTEYAVFPAFSLRMGYGSGLAQAASGGPLGALGGLGGGFGLKMGACRADYTFTPFGDLGNVQRISLGARF